MTPHQEQQVKKTTVEDKFLLEPLPDYLADVTEYNRYRFHIDKNKSLFVPKWDRSIPKNLGLHEPEYDSAVENTMRILNDSPVLWHVFLIATYKLEMREDLVSFRADHVFNKVNREGHTFINTDWLNQAKASSDKLGRNLNILHNKLNKAIMARLFNYHHVYKCYHKYNQSEPIRYPISMRNRPMGPRTCTCPNCNWKFVPHFKKDFDDTHSV